MTINCHVISDEEFKMLDDYENHRNDDYEDKYGWDRYESVTDHINHENNGQPCETCMSKIDKFSQEGIMANS